MSDKIRVGISSCVLGQKVRFDGGHKQNRFVLDVLQPFFEFAPVCPELASGMSVPRPTIRLMAQEQDIRLVETKDASVDHTESMRSFSEHHVSSIRETNLCGYILCAKSPTCGMQGVKVYHQSGVRKDGIGLYAQSLMTQMPWLPIEEDGRLNDMILRENFVMRVFCLHDLYQAMGDSPTAQKIIAFHSRYKYTLMAHDPVDYKTLGHMVANIHDYPVDTFFERYRLIFMSTLTKRASRKNSTNVLMHLQGYFKKVLPPKQKAELTQIIHDYRQGFVPLLVPITMLKHYLLEYPNDYLAQQHYLNPYPQDLKLRYGL